MKQFGFFKKSLGLALSAAMLFTAASGCGKKEEASVRDVTGSTVATQTTAVTREIKMYTAAVGDEVSDQDISMTVDHAYVSDYTFMDHDETIGITFFQVTMRNDGKKAATVNILSDCFAVVADGTPYYGSLIRPLQFIYKEFGEDAENFSEDLQPGETRQGYIGMEVPADFQDLTLYCYPAAGDGSMTEGFTFSFTRSEMEPAPEPVTPLGETASGTETAIAADAAAE